VTERVWNARETAATSARYDLVARLVGPHINRRTVENVRRAGLTVERVEDLGAGGIFKLIVAYKDREGGE